jgi:hypothetical protein
MAVTTACVIIGALSLWVLIDLMSGNIGQLDHTMRLIGWGS